MSVKIVNPESQPALVYDEIFMNSLKVDQLNQVDDTQPPRYTLRISYRIFATDDNNIRHFHPKTYHLEIDDFYKAAIEKAMAGDMDLANAMGAIELALGKIIEDQTDLGTIEVNI